MLKYFLLRDYVPLFLLLSKNVQTVFLWSLHYLFLLIFVVLHFSASLYRSLQMNLSFHVFSYSFFLEFLKPCSSRCFNYSLLLTGSSALVLVADNLFPAVDHSLYSLTSDKKKPSLWKLLNSFDKSFLASSIRILSILSKLNKLSLSPLIL